MNSFILLEDGLALSIDMQPYNVDSTHPNYNAILEAVRTNDWSVIPELVDVAKSVTRFCGGEISVDADAGTVSFGGEELDGSITERILRMMNEGFSVEPLVGFLKNLMQNSSKRAIDELYGFLEYGKMPITEDGHFLAYKRVNDDYTSVHDSKTDNSIGKIPEMPRNKVDDDKDRTCSQGLHFCSHGYLSNFSGSKVVVLKVNPADVVSIPSDYNNTKGRACRYEVVGELTPAEVEKAMHSGVWGSTVIGDYDDADRDFDDDGSDDDAECVSQSYYHGYSRGRVDGRNGTTQPGDPVVVTDFVSNTEEFVEGYKRGWKDGKGHKSHPNFAVDEAIQTDENTF
jgi:hypothetical protein